MAGPEDKVDFESAKVTNLSPATTFLASCSELAAMRSKTTEQLRSMAVQINTWREEFPWLLMGPHGIQCKNCKKAGAKGKWATGIGTLVLFIYRESHVDGIPLGFHQRHVCLKGIVFP